MPTGHTARLFTHPKRPGHWPGGKRLAFYIARPRSFRVRAGWGWIRPIAAGSRTRETARRDYGTASVLAPVRVLTSLLPATILTAWSAISIET
jgi:hypothetical protein